MAGAALGRGLAQIRGIPFISDVPPVLLSMSIATGAYRFMISVGFLARLRPSLSPLQRLRQWRGSLDQKAKISMEQHAWLAGSATQPPGCPPFTALTYS
jgi:hypothetical protein